MKQLFKRHEFVKIGIPLHGVVHPAFPFVILDGLDFLQQGKMSTVIDFLNSLMSKDLSLPSGTKRIEQIEETCKPVQQPCEPFGGAFRQPAP